MPKKNKLEELRQLDWICGQAKHLNNIYRDKRKEFPKGTIERLMVERITEHYQQIIHGACGLFNIGTEISATEYLPREMIEIKDYAEWLKKQPSTV